LFFPKIILVIILKKSIATKIIFSCHENVATESCFNYNLPHRLGWSNAQVFLFLYYYFYSPTIIYWVAWLHFYLSWPYIDVTLGCICMQIRLLHCDGCMDAMTTMHQIKELCQEVKA
jgi:hypothetical protein